MKLDAWLNRCVIVGVILAGGLGGASAVPVIPPAGMQASHDSTGSPDSYAAPVRPVGGTLPVTEVLTGTVRRQSFRGPEPLTAMAAVEAAAAPFRAAGFVPLLDCGAAACGGFDFRMTIEVLEPDVMIVNPTDFHQLTLRGQAPSGGVMTVSLLASRFAGQTHLQAVSVAEAPAVQPSPAPGRAPPAAATAPEPGPGADDPVALMRAELDARGSTVIEGLSFDRTGALAEEAESLDHAATVLQNNPGLSVAVVGHSDGIGALAVNLRISRSRAEAVVEALVRRGIARTRLSAEGVGWLAPRASNTTEAGRAANRRVVLVAR